MISYLQGKIVLKEKDFLILDVNGVGYKVFLAGDSLKRIPKIDSFLKLFTFPYLKRETFELYGFLNFEELKLFEILDEIPGVGPKTALVLASFGSLKNLEKAIEKDDKRLQKIGIKKRQRLFLELTGKIKELKKEISKKDEVFEALLALGFSKNRVISALSRVSRKIREPKERIKEALKILGKR